MAPWLLRAGTSAVPACRAFAGGAWSSENSENSRVVRRLLTSTRSFQRPRTSLLALPYANYSPFVQPSYSHGSLCSCYSNLFSLFFFYILCSAPSLTDSPGLVQSAGHILSLSALDSSDASGCFLSLMSTIKPSLGMERSCYQLIHREYPSFPYSLCLPHLHSHPQLMRQAELA